MITEAKAKLWSKLGSRATYGQAMMSLPEKTLKFWQCQLT